MPMVHAPPRSDPDCGVGAYALAVAPEPLLLIPGPLVPSRLPAPLVRASLVLVFTLIPLVAAADVRVLVLDQNGQPLANAVIESRHEALQRVPDEIAVIDQVNKRFEPMVIAIAQGQSVNFPNNDNIRHHVYSFSPIRQFSNEM